jgi:hypothetical protein
MSVVVKVIKNALTLSLLILFFSGCSNDDEKKTRSFYMGFTPFPYEVSQDALDFVYGKLATDADIVNQHFDDGVPWVEALADEDFHANIIADWTYRKEHTPSTHKLYLSVTPINFNRDGLASYRGESSNMELPSPWDIYKFNDANVKTAYLNYCKRIINFFEPDFFNMAIEANLLHVKNAALWSDYLELHQYIYESLKTTYPTLQIFCSISGAPLLNNFTDDDHVAERSAVQDLMAYADLYALSFYPYLSGYLGNQYPSTTFDDLFTISEKPLAVAETGYAAQTFSIDTGNGIVTVNSDQDKQKKYIDDLLAACTKYKARFVINFVLRDYDQLWESLGSPNDITIAWKDTGMYDENGSSRKAYVSWKNYFNRTKL